MIAVNKTLVLRSLFWAQDFDTTVLGFDSNSRKEAHVATLKKKKQSTDLSAGHLDISFPSIYLLVSRFSNQKR